MTVKEMQKECFELAQEKGWGEKEILVPEMVALLCSEACEALEEYRSITPLMYMDENETGKPCGVASEFADIAIRLGHYAGVLGFDLESAIEVKLAYNKTRPHRHGGKKC